MQKYPIYAVFLNFGSLYPMLNVQILLNFVHINNPFILRND